MKGYVKRSVLISEECMKVIEAYADMEFMTASQVMRMALERWAKNASYTVNMRVPVCQDREDPTV